MKKYFTKFLILALIALTTAQCSEDDSNDEIGVFLDPPNPSVETVPITVTVNDKERSINPPWTRFRIKLVNNNETDALYILNVTFKVSATKNGVLNDNATTASLDPSDVLDSAGDPRKNTVAILSPGQDFITDGLFYIEGLPDADNDQADSFVFPIEATIFAYTGKTETDPDKTIKQRFNFTTEPPR